MPDSTPNSRDSDLVQLFLQGDAEVVRTVDGWISQAAWSYRQRLSEEWEDILQEIRLELTRLLSRGSFRGDSSLKTYLWRVVNHTCIDRLRRNSRWRWQGLEDLDHRGVLAEGARQGKPQRVPRSDDSGGGPDLGGLPAPVAAGVGRL